MSEHLKRQATQQQMAINHYETALSEDRLAMQLAYTHLSSGKPADALKVMESRLMAIGIIKEAHHG